MTLFVFMGLFVRKLLGDFFFFFFLNREQNAGADSPGWKLFKKKKKSPSQQMHRRGKMHWKGGRVSLLSFSSESPPTTKKNK